MNKKMTTTELDQRLREFRADNPPRQRRIRHTKVGKIMDALEAAIEKAEREAGLN